MDHLSQVDRRMVDDAARALNLPVDPSPLRDEPFREELLLELDPPAFAIEQEERQQQIQHDGSVEDSLPQPALLSLPPPPPPPSPASPSPASPPERRHIRLQQTTQDTTTTTNTKRRRSFEDNDNERGRSMFFTALKTQWLCPHASCKRAYKTLGGLRCHERAKHPAAAAANDERAPASPPRQLALQPGIACPPRAKTTTGSKHKRRRLFPHLPTATAAAAAAAVAFPRPHRPTPPAPPRPPRPPPPLSLQPSDHDGIAPICHGRHSVVASPPTDAPAALFSLFGEGGAGGAVRRAHERLRAQLFGRVEDEGRGGGGGNDGGV
ncbi:hypothetical protein GTA08_BOTSDO12682 [Botryosphaeria dothidea]|uniref:C2H2-type domain-containing protein n=1 Tax=Botryosphaeria dothidea TaxID=55169 RepID=A0A8H4NE36_9PEZI|nr:hypothetical protein GTA08_BOTSDO12682 [Botryosphaeria dothidea]